MPAEPAILFTAFEPSGDEHAAAVIAELRRRAPEVPIRALGGPRMAEAGAELIERTTDRSVMLGGAASQAWSHHRRLRRLKRWLDVNPVAVHVPTDSPAANWAICKLVKRRWGGGESAGDDTDPQGVPLGRVVHLVAPQVWAWATWRVRRLRKWSDLVLCLLPFEPDWFAQHGVEARFIGHPLFDRPAPETEADPSADEALSELEGRPRIALLPGSRAGEVRNNWPVMRQVLQRVAGHFERPAVAVAAADERGAELVRSDPPEIDSPLSVRVGGIDSVLQWADAVLTVSGTVTLHVTRHRKPMAIVYRVSPWAWYTIGWWLISTRTFTLPNLIANEGVRPENPDHIVREFVPWLDGDTEPIAEELVSLIEDERKRTTQIEALRSVREQFRHHNAGREGAEAIRSALGTRTASLSTS